MSGAFQTSREIFSSPIWKSIVDFRLFFLIYGSAVFADEGVRLADDLVLKRGEWCRSIRKIQEDLQYIENRQIKTYSTSVISRCIKRLVDMQMVCTRMHELGTVFTVVNYERYQGFDNYKKQNLEQNLEQSGNSSGTVGEQSGNNNNNDNKEKKVKKVNKDIVYSLEFESFFDSYPKQVGKPAAFNNYKKLRKDDKYSAEYLMACAMNYQSYCIANKTEHQFIKMPNNFLNAKDEYFKQFETPVLIHSRSGQAPSAYQRQKDKFDQMLMDEEAKNDDKGGYYQAY